MGCVVDVAVGGAGVAVGTAWTTIVPVMIVGCTSHSYVYVPGVVNVCEKVWGVEKVPDSHGSTVLAGDVGGEHVAPLHVLCGTAPLFHVQVTVSPAWIVVVDVPETESVKE